MRKEKRKVKKRKWSGQFGGSCQEALALSREERVKRDGLFAGEGTGIGKRKKSKSPKNKEINHKAKEILKSV